MDAGSVSMTMMHLFVMDRCNSNIDI
jgi:hypothetical protein